MRNDEISSFAFSLVFHVSILIIAIFGLPQLFTKLPEQPTAITVELLPVTGITNVKPAEQNPSPVEKPEPKPETKPDPTPEPPKPKAEKEVVKPQPPVKQDTPPPPPPEPKPDAIKEEKKPEPKPVEKKPEPKKEKPKEKAKVEDLDSILKAVKETAQKETKPDSKISEQKEDGGAKNKSKSDSYDPSLPLSLSEMDAVKSQISKCWNMPAGAKDAENLTVKIRAQYNADGSLIKATIADESKRRYNSDTFYRAAADSALRAVQLCTPLKNLPADKFSTWKNIEMNFDPRDMLQ